MLGHKIQLLVHFYRNRFGILFYFCLPSSGESRDVISASSSGRLE
ncbi:unnamed protein product [Larinioides sclopetarius]|uniref:Uncharacterized protein n=1 Tax=Larinioides sclopetarius TaxID=280406 RepID=A0AAV1Z3Z1_9ARAC